MRIGRKQIQWLVPVASLLVMGAMEAWKLTLPDTASGKAFLEKARNVVESFPPRVTGPDGVEWESREIELPTQAKNLLNTNTYVSREYQSNTGGRQWISTVLFIEVADSRDMVGHYPPNCYPSNGWQLQGPGEWAVWTVEDLSIPGVEYTFKRKQGGRDEMKIVRDFFILPNGNFYPDLASFKRVASGFAIRNFGATQVQIIYDRDYLPEDREKIFQSLIKAHMPLIEAVRKKD